MLTVAILLLMLQMGLLWLFLLAMPVTILLPTLKMDKAVD